MHAGRPSLALALALAAALALPGLASAQARRPAGASPGAGGPQLGLLVGFEDGDGDTGLALRVDGEWPLQVLSPQIRMSLVGSVGLSRWDFNSGFFSEIDTTLTIFKLTPALRFSFGNNPTIRPYGDIGLGVHYASLSFSAPGISDSDSDVSIHMRFAGGILFHLSPAFSLGGEIDFTPYFGEVNDSTVSLLFSAQFRL